MATRFLIAFLLIASGLQAQVFQTNNQPYKFRGLKAADLLIAPKGCDTTALSNPKWGESTAGALFVDTCNNRLYFYNGLKWNHVTGGGGGVDSFYYNFRNLNDTTLLWDRGDGVVDTLVFSGGTSLIGAYIDDIKAIGQDLYYYKNGDSTFIVNIAQGSTGGDTTIFSFVVDTTNVARFQIPYADTTGYFKGDTALTWQPSDKTLVTDNLYMYGTDASRAAKMWFKIPNPTFGYRPRIYAGMLPTDVANGAIYFSGGGSNALMEINSGDNNQLLLHSPDGEMLFKQTDGLYRFYNVPNETSYNKMLVINDSGFVAWKATADISGKLNISDTLNMLRNAVRSIYRKAGSDSVFAVSGAGTAFAFRDSTGGGGGGITIDSVAVRRIPQGSFNHYVGFNSGVGGTGTSGGNVTTDNVQAGENLVMFKDAGFSFRTAGRFDGQNLLIGTSSGKWVTNSAFNVGVGFQTLGGANASIADSLWAGASGGGNHIAIGFQALSKLKGSDAQSSNVAIGARAMDAYVGCGGCTNSQVAIGTDALGSLTSGQRNTAVGGGAVQSVTTGSGNTGLGFLALGSATGSNNTALGAGSLFGVAGQNNNVGIGVDAGISASGGGNTFVGFSSGNNGAGSNNIAIGNSANSGTSGANNIVIGQGIGVLSNTSSNQLSIGSGAIRWLISDVSGSSRRWTFNGTTSDITATEASAALEVRSTSGGILFPRMTATQASAIGSPADGLMIYVIDTNTTFITVGFWGRENGIWVKK